MAESVDETVLRGLVAGRGKYGELGLDAGAYTRRLSRLLDAAGSPPRALVIEDVYLATACDHGHARAWAVLECRMVPAVARILRKRGVADEAALQAASDLPGSLVLAAGHGRQPFDRYAGRAGLVWWLAGIAFNAVRHARRAAARQHDAVPGARSRWASDPSQRNGDPAAVLAQREELEALRRAVLTPPERASQRARRRLRTSGGTARRCREAHAALGARVGSRVRSTRLRAAECDRLVGWALGTAIEA